MNSRTSGFLSQGPDRTKKGGEQKKLPPPNLRESKLSIQRPNTIVHVIKEEDEESVVINSEGYS